MKLSQLVTKIENKNDLLQFLSELRNDFETNKSTWENQTLQSYLEAMKAWLEDIEGWEKNCNMDISKMNPWELFGHILYASKVYE